MRKQFDFYAYTSNTAGKYYIGGVEYFYGEDFRSVKRYKEYMDAGFNMLLLQHENSYSGEEFEGSACHKCMTEAYKAGLDRIIVSDTRLKDLCEEKLLVGEEGKFKTEEEFLQYLDDCTRPYRNQPGFCGVQLFDEPQYWKLESYGKVCRGLKQIIPDIFLQCNLLNICFPPYLSENEPDSKKAYEWYLNKFLDESGLDYVMTDEYPFLKNYILSEQSIPVYQILAKVAKERGVEFRMVLQSFSAMHVILGKQGTMEGGFLWRRIMEEDMYWQMNLAMGFGCKEYSFYTYFTKTKFNQRPDDLSLEGVDGAAFINRDGTKTRLYHFTKKIIKEVKKFESVLLPYNYDNSWLIFQEGKSAQDYNWTRMAIINENCPISVKISDSVAIVTKLCKKGSTMYMVENIGNVKDTFDNSTKMCAEITLNVAKNKVKFYKKGELKQRRLKNGKFVEHLGCGEAIFIEIED